MLVILEFLRRRSKSLRPVWPSQGDFAPKPNKTRDWKPCFVWIWEALENLSHKYKHLAILSSWIFYFCLLVFETQCNGLTEKCLQQVQAYGRLAPSWWRYLGRLCSLEEIHPWEQVLRVYSLASFPDHFLLQACGWRRDFSATCWGSLLPHLQAIVDSPSRTISKGKTTSPVGQFWSCFIHQDKSS